MSLITPSVIILAAGNSSRMGQPKFALKLPNGKTFLEEISHRFADFGCEEIITVLNSEGAKYIGNSAVHFPENFRISLNLNPESGRFSSLQCGLKTLNSETPIFIHNVDNPFINSEILNELIKKLSGFDFVKPVYKGKGGHPLLVNQNIANAAALEKDTQTNLRTFLTQFSGTSLEVKHESILWNINTPGDLVRFSEKW